VNLRNIAGPVYTIQDESAGERVIGTLDEVSALSQCHDHAVYLHGADTYFVNHLDLDQKIVRVERRDLDYYTQSIQTSQIQLDETEEELEWRGGPVGFGDVTVTTSIPMFKKIRFHSRDSLGFEKLELPPQLLETVAFWFSPSQGVCEAMAQRKMIVGEGLIGIANVLVEVAPFFVMCDTSDVGTVIDSSLPLVRRRRRARLRHDGPGLSRARPHPEQGRRAVHHGADAGELTTWGEATSAGRMSARQRSRPLARTEKP